LRTDRGKRFLFSSAGFTAGSGSSFAALFTTFVIPSSLYSAWRCVDLMERMGELSPHEAMRWKQGIFGLMATWGLEPQMLQPQRAWQNSARRREGG
jgi:hypothetical protein